MKLCRTGAICFPLLITLSIFAVLSVTPLAIGKQVVHEPPKAKQTSLGFYVTAKEAYDKWLSAPGEVKVFDVRTLEEYIFVGHAPMAWNIPLLYQTHKWSVDKGHFAMQPNPDFLSQVEKVARPEDTILVMCRSGGRSAMAVNMLAEAGFTKVYNIIDGMEGDVVKDPGSVFKGQRLKNGWKNSGAPWTYKIDPEKVKPTGHKE